LKDILDAQEEFWERTFSETPNMFGEEPAYPARKAADLFKKEGKINILELGCGQGRDTIFFAKNGFRVHVLDYSDAGIKAITSEAQSSGLSGSIIAARHDVREPLPFEDEFFDGCYSHML